LGKCSQEKIEICWWCIEVYIPARAIYEDTYYFAWEQPVLKPRWQKVEDTMRTKPQWLWTSKEWSEYSEYLVNKYLYSNSDRGVYHLAGVGDCRSLVKPSLGHAWPTGDPQLSREIFEMWRDYYLKPGIGLEDWLEMGGEAEEFPASGVRKSHEPWVKVNSGDEFFEGECDPQPFYCKLSIFHWAPGCERDSPGVPPPGG
jgi:hypothetical protein